MSKINITIAVPAFNEEKNISGLLNSLLNQKTVNINISSIVIYLDGCTDDTEKIVKSFHKKYKFIIPIVSSQRKGKIYRLNQTFKKISTEILAIFDADIILGTRNTLQEMVNVLLRDSSAQVVAAHQVPIKPTTIVGKAIYGGYKVWDDARLAVPNFDHIQNFYGAATAYRGTFAKKLHFPNYMTDDRGYVYLKAKELNGFRYIKSGFIYYHPVNTIRDFFKLADRSFNKNEAILAKCFGQKVYIEYKIPRKYIYASILSNFLKDPIYTSLGLVLNVLARALHVKDKLYTSGTWEIATSTKKPIYAN